MKRFKRFIALVLVLVYLIPALAPMSVEASIKINGTDYDFGTALDSLVDTTADTLVSTFLSSHTTYKYLGTKYVFTATSAKATDLTVYCLYNTKSGSEGMGLYKLNADGKATNVGMDVSKGKVRATGKPKTITLFNNMKTEMEEIDFINTTYDLFKNVVDAAIETDSSVDSDKLRKDFLQIKLPTNFVVGSAFKNAFDTLTGKRPSIVQGTFGSLFATVLYDYQANHKSDYSDFKSNKAALQFAAMLDICEEFNKWEKEAEENGGTSSTTNGDNSSAGAKAVAVPGELTATELDEMKQNFINTYSASYYKNSDYSAKLQKELLNGAAAYLGTDASDWWTNINSGASDFVSNENSKEYVWGYDISMMPGSESNLTQQKKHTADKDTLIPNAQEEMENMLAKLNLISDVAIDDNTPFQSLAIRVRYLVNATEQNPEIADVDPLFEQITMQPSVQATLPAFPYLTPIGTVAGNPFRNSVDVVNDKAYQLLLHTLDEMYYYRDLAIRHLDGQDFSGSLASLSREINIVGVMYEAVNYINCKETWSFWNEEYEGTSLAALYVKLLNNNKFTEFDAYAPTNKDDPFTLFFDHPTETLSNDLLTGMAESAKYLSMQTNVYDPYTIRSCTDADFIAKDGFHYKYGYHRKALMLDTNADAAVAYYNAGTKGTLRVCTLKDLINPSSDVVLYLDENLYNADELEELQKTALGTLPADKDSIDEDLWNTASKLADAEVTSIIKQSPKIQYMSDIDSDDTRLMSDEKISEWFEATEYNALQAFSVVSAVYKNKDIYNAENTICKTSRPVFIASSNLCQIKAASTYEKNTIYNYALLKNLKSNMSINYTSNLDMSSPVFMDIYGNILTESGTVVVPVAANATLHNDDYFPASSAFASYYGDEWSIPGSYKNVTELLSDNFAIDEVTGNWEMRSRLIDGVANMAMLSIADTESLDAMRKLYAYNLNQKSYNYDIMRHIVIEVLRGAPIEYIDDTKENIAVVGNYDKAGIQATAKLEALDESLGTSKLNAVLSIPNLSFTANLQYWALMIFKVCVIIAIIIMCIVIYADIVGPGFSLHTIGKCLMLPAIMVLAAISIPIIFEVTYYQSNRALLQNETEYIAMLNEEKRSSGKEIGVYSINQPDLSTELFVKLVRTDINWYDVFGRVYFNNIQEELNDVYEEYTEDNMLSEYDQLTVTNDGVYVSLDKLFDTVDITFLENFKTLYGFTKEEPIVSFYSPFYFICEQLIENVNYYNQSNNVYSYATTLQSGGELKTLGLCRAYFESEDFFNHEGDYFNLSALYDIPQDYVEDRVSDFVSDNEEVLAARNSQWYNANLTEDEIRDRSYLMYERAKEFVSTNKDLLGRISDATFIKVMALDLAIYYNNLFGIPSANTIEIKNLSTDDLLRLATAKKEQVMEYSTMSYPRFIWEIGGTPAVIAAAILTCTNFVGGFVKPITVLIAYIVIFSSLFIYKVVLRKKDYSIAGFFVTMLLLSGSNVLYALILKLSVVLPQYLAIPSAAAILVQVILQLIYMYVLISIVAYTLKDFRGLGSDKYIYKLESLFSKNHKTAPSEVEAEREAKDGMAYYKELVNRQAERQNVSFVGNTTRIKGGAS